MRVRYNVAVNLLGRAASVVIGIVLLPVYLKILGIEAVGLIGFYTTLISIVAVVEHIFGVMVMRETARLSEVPGGAQRQRELLRTMEFFYFLFTLAVAITITITAPHISRVWLSSSNLSPATINNCLTLMAWTIPLQLLFGVHLNALTGLERQVQVNVLTVLFGVLRGAVTLAVLLIVATTSEAYFAAQLLTVGLCLVLSFSVAWRQMPQQGSSPAVRPAIFLETWRYGSTLTANAILFVLFAQADKLIVSALLPLKTFGYYVLATTIASLPWSIIGPVTLALLPRFARLLEQGAENDIRRLFHLTSQFVALALLPVAVVAVFHPELLVLLWTNDAQAAMETRWLVPLLTAGTILMSLTCVPNAIQLAAGWTHMPLLANLIGSGSLPLAYALTRYYGAEGAAVMWVIVGCLHLTVPPLLLHRRILRGERGRWYLIDLGIPALAAATVGFISRMILSPPTTRFGILLFLGLIWALATSVIAVLSPELRNEALRLVQRPRPNRDLA